MKYFSDIIFCKNEYKAFYRNDEREMKSYMDIINRRIVDICNDTIVNAGNTYLRTKLLYFSFIVQ